MNRNDHPQMKLSRSSRHMAGHLTGPMLDRLLPGTGTIRGQNAGRGGPK
jgi:hypothetical protein